MCAMCEIMKVINKCTVEYIWQSWKVGIIVCVCVLLKLSLIGIYILRVLLIVDHVECGWIVLVGIKVITGTTTSRCWCRRRCWVWCEKWYRQGGGRRRCGCQGAHVIPEAGWSGRLVGWRCWGALVLIRRRVYIAAWVVQLSLTVVMWAGRAHIVTRIGARSLLNFRDLLLWLGEYVAWRGWIIVGWLLLSLLGGIIKWIVQWHLRKIICV